MKRIIELYIVLTFLIASPVYAEASRDFNGTSQFLTDTSTSGLPSAIPVSIVVWAKPDSVTGTHRLWCHGERSGAPDRGWSFGTTGDEIVMTTHEVKDYITTTMTVVTGEWQAFGATLDTGADVDFFHYRNSTNTLTTATVTHTTGMNNPGTDVAYIGCLDANTAGAQTEFWDGLIAYVHVFNVELTATEMIQEMKVPGSIHRGSVGYWLVLGDSTEIDLVLANDMTVTGSAASSDGPPVMLTSGMTQ